MQQQKMYLFSNQRIVSWESCHQLGEDLRESKGQDEGLYEVETEEGSPEDLYELPATAAQQMSPTPEPTRSIPASPPIQKNPEK